MDQGKMSEEHPAGHSVGGMSLPLLACRLRCGEEKLGKEILEKHKRKNKKKMQFLNQVSAVGL